MLSHFLRATQKNDTIPEVTFVQYIRNTATTNPQTTSINLGAEGAGRRIYVVFTYSNNDSSSVNSFSINGVAGTIVWNQSSVPGLNTNSTAHAVGVVELPTGTTGSITAQFSGLFSGPSYAIYNVIGNSGPIALYDGTTTLSASQIINPSITYNARLNGFAFFMLSTGTSSEIVNSVTGATYDGNSANFRFVAHAEKFVATGTNTVTFNLATVANSGYRITAVSF